jgi:hypothetical protein
MHFERVVAFHQHIAAPVAHADHERVDLEIGWRLPWTEDLQDPLLCIFVLDRGTSSFSRSPLAGPWWARYTPKAVRASSDITENVAGILVDVLRVDSGH